MADINRVIISGRLTRDPELRATAGGTAVLSFGVAVNDRRRNQQTGQWEDYANFIDCSMFGNRAEALSKILTKGTLVCCEGRLRWSSWERDGQKRSKIEVIVDEVVLPSRSQGGADGYQGQSSYQGGYGSQASSNAGGYQPAPAPSQGMPAQQPPMTQTYDDEIPF
ncbi:MAG: single-stranded DNA-binding protein [Coriobacteriales bacterium]|jgi:single-strand DNA-binding protein